MSNVGNKRGRETRGRETDKSNPSFTPGTTFCTTLAQHSSKILPICFLAAVFVHSTSNNGLAENQLSRRYIAPIAWRAILFVQRPRTSFTLATGFCSASLITESL